MDSKKVTYKKLILIVVIVFIICTILLITFLKTYNTNKVSKFINDMEVIESKVNSLNAEYLLWDQYDPNEAGNFSTYLQSKEFINASSVSNIYLEDFQKILDNLNSEESPYWNKTLDPILTNYCYFSPSSIQKNFDIDNSDYYIIINFYTGNIICKNGVEYNGKMYYRHYDLEKNLGINTYQTNEIPEIEIVENNGLNKKIKVSISGASNILEIYYLTSDTDEEKKRCTELSDYEYITEENAAYFTINISGNYTFIVEDGNYMQYPKVSLDITLCNKPVLESGMQGIYFDDNNEEILIESIEDKNWYDYSDTNFKQAYSKKEDGSYWMWVPRFVYKNLGTELKIDFVQNASETSTTNKSTINYILPNAFKDNVTGVWVKEENLNYYNTQKSDFFQKVLTNQ